MPALTSSWRRNIASVLHATSRPKMPGHQLGNPAKLPFVVLLVISCCTTASSQDPPREQCGSSDPWSAQRCWARSGVNMNIRPYVRAGRRQSRIRNRRSSTGSCTKQETPLGSANPSEWSMPANNRSASITLPEVQAIVSGIIERFVRPDESLAQGVGVRLVTVGNPNWRSSAMSLMRPVSVTTPGLDAWLLR